MPEEQAVYMQVGRYCYACGADLVYDPTGEDSKNGVECWYCPECYWYTTDFVKYPRPVTA